jgi:uncharacterized protein (TIGR00266 family)
MKVYVDEEMQFPMAQILLDAGETVRIQQGSMIYHSPGVGLSAHMNAKGSGLGKFVKAVARSAVSGESFFITEAQSQENRGFVALAPSVPGTIKILDLGARHYRLNDGAFLAMDTTCEYNIVRQSLGKAFLSGQGGLFIMETGGQGQLLVNAYGSIVEIDLNGANGFTVDNCHVVAWDSMLQYEISLSGGGVFQSLGTGEGVVNRFSGTGKIYIQTLNLATFASSILPFLPSGDGSRLGLFSSRP